MLNLQSNSGSSYSRQLKSGLKLWESAKFNIQKQLIQ